MAGIPAAISDPEGHDLAFVMDAQMELEAKEPALGQTWEDPVAADGALWQSASLVLAVAK